MADSSASRRFQSKSFMDKDDVERILVTVDARGTKAYPSKVCKIEKQQVNTRQALGLDIGQKTGKDIGRRLLLGDSLGSLVDNK